MGQNRPCAAAASACLRCGERVRMDLDQREVAEDEAERNTIGFEELDVSVGEARVRALVVAEDEERRPA